jgi:nicotinamide phosphoribosyltransferase
VLTDYIPRLRDKILARDGKIVIRPDSGDPVKILCGDPDKPLDHPAYQGAIRLLAKALGTHRGDGLPLINKAGVIYGDSITVDRADQILHRVTQELKLSPYNCVFGIGSFTYEYVTRDTYGYAMKATAVRRGDKLCEIFKKPVTDSGEKISHKGIPAVYSVEDSPEFYVVQGATLEQLNSCAFEKVYKDGALLIDEDFETIRKRVRA